MTHARFEKVAPNASAYATLISNTRSGWKGHGNKLKSSMKLKRHLPCAPFPPTKAAYQKPVEGYGRYMKVVTIPSEYNPKPAPIPKVKRFVEKKPAPKELPIYTKQWPKERVDRLIELYNAGVKYDDIAEEIGTHKSTISEKIHLLLMRGTITPRRNTSAWSDEELATLKRLYMVEKKSFKEISQVLGRTEKACNETYRRKVLGC